MSCSIPYSCCCCTQKGELTLKEYTQWSMDHTDLSMQLMNILFEVYGVSVICVCMCMDYCYVSWSGMCV